MDQIRLGCYVSHREVSRCCTREESEESIVSLKPSADATRSPKQGYQLLSKRTDIFQERFSKKTTSRTVGISRMRDDTNIDIYVIQMS